MNARPLLQDRPKAAKQPVLQQYSALCFRIKRGRPEVLLITTRKSRRWIIPKGWLIPGLSPQETALQEAWEEAGVTGHCSEVRLGQFLYHKHRLNRLPTLCLVDVFPVHVLAVEQNYPETGARKRKWFSPKKAAQKVNSPELAEMLRDFKPYTH
ncbi:NUDIX hydrolase [uncultured Ruegeria sp.]|uniref:NUDIX hydrolase n=1 Tax=uncultured Ruegeria sp. TaxID=259304 RepID=UPI002606ADF5|nr:NUDIX hydrolase [uncultured Ruegeria sp.]